MSGVEGCESLSTNAHECETEEHIRKIDQEFSDVLKSLSEFRSQVTVVQQGVRGLEKTVKRTIKDFKKQVSKGRSKGASRRPSGFAKPTVVSAELCAFMNKPEGSEVARTDATQFLISYICQNNLQNPEDRRSIKPDDRLQKLLGVGASREITYFEIQRFMNRHFVGRSNNHTSLEIER